MRGRRLRRRRHGQGRGDARPQHGHDARGAHHRRRGEPGAAHGIAPGGVADSLQRHDVDGCTSTNDTVLLLASGAAGPPADLAALTAAVADACADLAAQMAGDAEGATKVVRLHVTGAHSDDEARVGARKVAESQLVKCSWYGKDPYWGRIASELGSAGIEFDPDRLERPLRRHHGGRAAASTSTTTRQPWPPTWPGAHLDIVCRPRARRRPGPGAHQRPHPRLHRREHGHLVSTTSARAEAEERAAVLVEALPYIQRFRGRRVVVKYGGNAMIDPALASTFAADIVLLHSVGIRARSSSTAADPRSATSWSGSARSPSSATACGSPTPRPLDIARMVLVGKVNREHRRRHQLPRPARRRPLGRGRRAHRGRGPRDPDLGFVGDVHDVNPAILERLLAEDLIPVVSTIGADAGGPGLQHQRRHRRRRHRRGARAPRRSSTSPTSPACSRDVADPTSLINRHRRRRVAAGAHRRRRASPAA